MRACLAISSFRYDASVLALLDRAAADGALDLFSRIVVVDSVGTGKMAELLATRFGDRVEYHCAERNIGSAGNLALRLQLAARGEEDVVYAVNHDGSVEQSTVRTLLGAAATLGSFGAIYPLRRMTARGRAGYDITGSWSYLSPMRTVATPPAERLLPVWWSSSNPALYALEPVREGLLPWADLWMGWEDLGYGWLLAERGYAQFIATTAITDDGYELRPLAGGVAHVSDKPTWYAYYYSRNLVLIARRTHRPAAAAALVARMALEVGVTVTVRKNRRKRLGYLARGLADGLRGRAGKWELP
jgi:hypothetical protein